MGIVLGLKFVTKYAHLNEILVNAGNKIKWG